MLIALRSSLWIDSKEFIDRADIGQVFPEELLEFQHDLEDELYREFAQVKA